MEFEEISGIQGLAVINKLEILRIFTIYQPNQLAPKFQLQNYLAPQRKATKWHV